MGLVLSRKINEKYYLFVTETLQPGDYVEIQKISIKPSESNYEGHNIRDKIEANYDGCNIKDKIEAPKSVLILREEHVKIGGGLEKVVEKIKQGKEGVKKIIVQIEK